MKTQSIGKTQALALYEAKWWEGRSFRDIAEFQFLTKELTMPFDKFHEAVEKTIGRPVYTHEFGYGYDQLAKELFDGAPAPSFEEIMNLIPEEKRIVVAMK